MDVRRRRRLRVLAIVVVAGLTAGVVAAWRELGNYGGPASARTRAPGWVFLVDPYVQLGDAPRAASSERLTVLWQAADAEAAWSVEVRDSASAPWRRGGEPQWRRAGRTGGGPRRFYRATLEGLEPGGEVSYRVKRNGATVFNATARARRPAGQPHRFVALGDGGANTWAQSAVAHQAARARPDYIVVTGDLVYYKGRLSEYLGKFFPIYNSDLRSPTAGAPLLRSVPFLVVPGNHDLLERDLGRYPDALAYFLVWALPLNGPLGAPGVPNSPTLRGGATERREFLELAGDAYPRMANYSFDYGDAHWTMLDTNPYADWTDPRLVAWLEADLASARDARWRFVAFHQPPFHSSRAHADEQRTRVLAPLLEKHGVDLVFSGHIHNYQRSYPLRFRPEPRPDGRLVDAKGHVAGQWTLDRTFDGQTRTRPDGIIYLVTGAGGARLYDSSQHGDTASLLPYTARFASDNHSLTIVDVEADRLTVRQVTGEGEEIDRFVVTR
jgi:3',5'-cyclic AMP phosphodiesterase CpdA